MAYISSKEYREALRTLDDEHMRKKQELVSAAISLVKFERKNSESIVPATENLVIPESLVSAYKKYNKAIEIVFG